MMVLNVGDFIILADGGLATHPPHMPRLRSELKQGIKLQVPLHFYLEFRERMVPKIKRR